MKILFAPDYREGSPYQQALAAGLESLGTSVSFLSAYRRFLPLARGVPSYGADVLHLHWPEAYFGQRGTQGDRLRLLRYGVDLRWATRGLPLVYTAHNLLPHRWRNHPVVEGHIRKTIAASDRIIVHSTAAGEALSGRWPREANPEKLAVIPHGDLSIGFPKPVSDADARGRLAAAPEGPFALFFGVIDIYKGLEELLGGWGKWAPDVPLVVVGYCADPALRDRLAAHPAVEAGRVHLHIDARVTDETLRDWLCACGCVVFNYREILTSGGASLARSMGVPILLPARHRTVDLMEPDLRVFRFGDPNGLTMALEEALAVGADYAEAAAWRAHIGWDRIARLHAKVYEGVGNS